MVRAGGIGLDEGERRLGEAFGLGRITNLVADDGVSFF